MSISNGTGQEPSWDRLRMIPGRTATEGSPFPPIGEYGFLSDCETTALVAPSGNVEWMCLPRLDSPSVFGAILDRSAGGFRLGPEGVTVPAARRYIPGTMVLETSWGTPTGWLVVQDALLMGPWHHEGELSHSHRRTPPRLRRRARPAADRALRDRPGAGDFRLRAGLRVRAAPGDLDSCGRGLPSGHVLERARPAPDLRGGQEPPRLDGAPLAALARPGPVPRPSVEPSPAAQRSHAEGADLRPLRRAGGGPHHLAAGTGPRRAELGLPVLLAARLRVHAVEPVHARLRLGGGGLLLVPVRPRPAGRRAAGHVRGGRGAGPARADPGASGRLRRRPPGADRQRRPRAAPARRVGHGDAVDPHPAGQLEPPGRPDLGGDQTPGRLRAQVLA